MALSVVIILRITATMTTFGFFPVASRRSWNALSPRFQLLALGGDLVITELPPDSKHRGELFDHRRLPLRRPRWHDGDERCDHPRIKPIVLGQSPTGLSELPQLERIDLAHRHASREQSRTTPR